MKNKKTNQTLLNKMKKGEYHRKKNSFKKKVRLFDRNPESFFWEINGLIGFSKGFVTILLAIFVPVIMLGAGYLIKYTNKSNVDISNFEVPYVVGVNLSKSFNPGKTWDEQKTYLYSIAARTYNDEFPRTGKEIAFTPSSAVKVKSSEEVPSIGNLYDFYKNYCTKGRELKGIGSDDIFIRQPISDFIYNEAKKSGTYLKYSTGAGTVVYESSKYKENKNKLQLEFNNKGQILVSCKELKRQAVVDVPRLNVDIIIAIPTNRASNTTGNSNTENFGDYTNESTANSTPIRQIAKACQSFLKPFLHTAGVAVGIVPYSGKVTMSPYSNYTNYTTQMLMNSNGPNLPYAMQSMFYGSDGKAGGDIVLGSGGNLAYGDYQNWGSSTIGLPIMARRGRLLAYRGTSLSSGALSGKTGRNSLLLDMTTSPTAGDNYKFMRMNTNPCYLGFCNLLAMTCEKDCPTYMANPYFMTELTSDIQGLIYDLELFVPFKDEKNKSNFLFLPIVMAGNMFSWGDHPSKLPKEGRVSEPDRANKARAVVIIANAPDNFEPQEMTYLGFNNDYSEIPMIESDTILFNEDRGYAQKGNKYMGTKGVVYFSSGSGSLTNTGYLFNGNSTARISFPNKGLLKVVAEREDPATIVVYNDNGVTQNLGETTFLGTKTLNFTGPQRVNNYSDLGTNFQSGYFTTGGPNFGNNLSTKKVKIKFSGCKLNKATISNQILRFYSSYDGSLVENNSGSIWSGAPAAMKKKMDPCIDASENYNNSTSGWLFNSGGYINAYDFKPKCYGVSKLNRFVMAADGFNDSAVVADNAKINYNSSWNNIGSIKYDTSSGRKYRSYTGTSSYPSSTNYSQVSTGKFQIESYYYYKLFASQKYRTRSINQWIDTYRSWPEAYHNSEGSNSSACCSAVWNPRRVGYSCPGTCYYWDTCYRNSTCYRTESCYQSKTCYTSDTCYRNATCYSNGTCTRHVSQTCTRTEAYSCTKKRCTWIKGKKESTEVCEKFQGTCHRNVSYDCGYNESYSCQKPYSCTESYSCSKPYDCSYYYSCQKPYSCQEAYSCEKSRSCTVTCYKTVYDQAGYNDSSSCSGVSWQHYLAAPSGWSTSDSYKSVSCSGYRPTTRYQRQYSTSQSQYSNTCSFSDGATDNCSCSWPSISTPSVANYSRADCSQSSSSCSTSGSTNISVGSWSTPSTTAQKRFYSFYKRNPDGSTQNPTFEICNSSGHSGCSSTSYSGRPTGTRDDSLTQRSPYRYNLYNFFFVSGDSAKTTTFSYSGNNTLTSKISSEADANLLQNKGVYLLPTGEANTYWVCFCGDAALRLDFTDATDSSITFSNIKNVNYNLSLDDTGNIRQTVDHNQNMIDTQGVFYIHPDQIKDNLDADGNYYVDISTTGKTRIVSIELTNRPLISEASSSSSGDIEIVGKDSSGGKVAGDSNTNVEFKMKRQVSFTVNAAPAFFWIEGQSDFRQTSGTARICGNSNKFAATVRATVPDAGSGKITLEAQQPVVTYKKSATDEWVNEVTPNYSYKLTSDRKLKSINVPSFVAPKASFSGGVQSKSYTFCSAEVPDISDQKLFDWSASSMSHTAATNNESFENKIFTDGEKNLNFNLTACRLISAQAKDLSMKFSPTINDFSKIRVSNKYGDNINNDNSKGFYVKRGDFVGWETEMQFDISEACNIYGKGTIELSANRTVKPSALTLYAGDSNFYWGTDNVNKTVSMIGPCDPEKNNASARMYERIESNIYEGLNYLNYLQYKVNSYDLMKQITFDTNDVSNHNYAGNMPFSGVGDIKIYVQPQRVKTTNYSKNMFDSEITSDVFGNYQYTFSEPNRLLNLDNEYLTTAKNSFVLLYTGGAIDGTSIPQGSYKNYNVTPTSSANGYYYRDVSVNNAELSISSSKIFSVGNKALIGQEGEHTEEKVTISPDDYTFEYRSDGYYYVKVPCRNVYLSQPRLTDSVILYYAHPNIINEKLLNTRIIDGYDQATNKNMKKYGNINYNNSSLPAVSAVQRLFYNSKTDNNDVYLYPKSSGTGAAATGEEGDFFIQLWDHKNEAPAVRWKIGSSIQSSTEDISVTGSGFSPFKSNYAFNGLHRMFFPYDVYNKDYGGYSYALNSALVFAGYTLPINLILASNGYQQSFKVNSSNVSSYTKPNAALESLAKDACSKLKTDLQNPDIYLIKYRTNSSLSLESCTSNKYTANNEEDLTDALMQIAKKIKQKSGMDVFRINVNDLN